jgi:MFS family permease
MLFKNFYSFIKIKPVLAVGFLFAASSLLFGSWVAAIPAIKHRLGFTNGSLGLSLLLSPLGAITGVFISPKIFNKIPVGKWMIAGYILLCGLMVLEINSINKLMFWICLYFFGLISFLNGVSTNATVNIMEKKFNRLFMSTCHALYSLGGAVSAGIAAFLISVNLSPGWQIVWVAAFIICVIIINKKHLLGNTDIIHSGAGLKLPSASVLGISFICMVVFMAEGCVADWSAIYFKDVLHSPKALLSLGYAGFSFAMTIGRLNGDPIVAAIGNKKTVIAGCLLASIGFIMLVFFPVMIVAVTGYIIIGLGCSCIVPVLFRTSAEIPGLTKVEGFAMVTTGGLIGFLTGPSIIGFIAEQASMSKGLSLLILMTIIAALVAWKNKYLIKLPDIPPSVPFDEQIY